MRHKNKYYQYIKDKIYIIINGGGNGADSLHRRFFLDKS